MANCFHCHKEIPAERSASGFEWVSYLEDNVSALYSEEIAICSKCIGIGSASKILSAWISHEILDIPCIFFPFIQSSIMASQPKISTKKLFRGMTFSDLDSCNKFVESMGMYEWQKEGEFAPKRRKNARHARTGACPYALRHVTRSLPAKNQEFKLNLWRCSSWSTSFNEAKSFAATRNQNKFIRLVLRYRIGEQRPHPNVLIKIGGEEREVVLKPCEITVSVAFIRIGTDCPSKVFQ